MYDNYIFDLYGLYEGAKTLLNELRQRGKGVYLLSNAQRLFTAPELRSLGIYDVFDDVMISSDIGFKLPKECRRLKGISDVLLEN